VEVLAIVPARGGSKGLPNKNILPLLGHPLIAYSIQAAKESSLVSRVLVSTDSPVIAEVSKKYGADVPFIRPSELAADLSRDLEVFQHALQWLDKNEGYKPDLVIQLRPTSPVRPKGLLDDAITRLNKSDADSLRIVTASPITPYKMWFVDNETSIMRPLLSLDGVAEPFNEPRQSLPKTYWQIGTLDVIRTIRAELRSQVIDSQKKDIGPVGIRAANHQNTKQNRNDSKQNRFHGLVLL
jgi:N-acylneuraminate cytidylyltransferase